MAGDWIKFDLGTSDKPEVWAIAEQLKIDPDAVVGKLLRVWAWFDQHTENGNAAIVTKMLLDRSVGVTGFCDEMINAGWMLQQDGEIILTNFDRHNGKTAKTRAVTAKRVALFKSKDEKSNDESNDGSVTSSLPREEKRREDIKELKNNSLDRELQKKPVSEKPKSKNGTRLPAEWVHTDEHVAAAQKIKPALTAERVGQIAEAFRDYWLAKPGAAGVKLDWMATWRTWIRNERDWHPSNPQRAPPQQFLTAREKNAIRNAEIFDYEKAKNF